MIINQKILKNKNIFNRFNSNIKARILRDDRIEMKTYLRLVSFKEIKYSFEDFTQDNYCYLIKERKFMYNLYDKGYRSLSSYCSEHNLLQNMIYPMLKRGISFNAKYIKENPILLELISCDINLSKFQIKFYDEHVELVGDKEDLKKFALENDIRYPVRMDPLTEDYHLAFGGILYLCLRKKFNV